MRAWHRAIALIEVTEAQEAQRKAEAEASAKRDVLKEAEDKPGTTTKKPTATKKADETPPKDDEGSLVSAVREQLQSTRAGGLKSRIDTALEAIEGGIKEADDDKRKR
jgi:hypothetical protein